MPNRSCFCSSAAMDFVSARCRFACDRGWRGAHRSRRRVRCWHSHGRFWRSWSCRSGSWSMDRRMTDAVQLISIAVSAGLLVTVIELVRRAQLAEEYSFIWIGCATALLVLSLWRNLLDLAAYILDVHY